ncbi:unnamed protein product [Urochloa humidicola]
MDSSVEKASPSPHRSSQPQRPEELGLLVHGGRWAGPRVAPPTATHRLRRPYQHSTLAPWHRSVGQVRLLWCRSDYGYACLHTPLAGICYRAPEVH